MDQKYQVIARKYRPQTFADVVGQEPIVTTLKNALRFNRLAHAYLFCGCRGTGKTTFARLLAKALNCADLTKDFEPCNQCSSCLDIMAGRSLNVLEIDGASNRGIDDIRQINETIGYAPASGKYKIYIIDEIHMLTKEAFNALLKTLEEPPPHVKFFFATTEPHKVLPTIISRCQRFDLNRIPIDALKEKLMKIAADLNAVCEEDVFTLIAGLTEGSLRDAESLLDQILCYAEPPITAAKVSATLGIMPRSSFLALDKAFDEQNFSFAFELAAEIFSSGKDLSYFLDNLIEHYRALLKLKLHASPSFSSKKLQEQYTQSACLYQEEQCLYILDFLIQWQQQISKTPFKRITLEMILLHILRSKYRITLPTLIKRLTKLEHDFKETPSSVQVTPIEAPTPVAAAPIETPPVPLAPVIEAPVPAQTTPLEVPTPVAAAPIETPLSLEEALLKKIQDKIEAAPLPVEVAPPPLILSKSQWETAASKKEKILPEEKPSSLSESRYDTIIRFAAVELEGVVKKGDHTHG